MVFLPRRPETVHTPVKMQGINHAHGKFSFANWSLGEWRRHHFLPFGGWILEKHTPGDLESVLQVASDFRGS
jgi:hypothetical protein